MERDTEQKKRKIKQIYVSPLGVEETVDISDDVIINEAIEKSDQKDIENFRKYAKQAKEDLDNTPSWSEKDMRANLSMTREDKKIPVLGSRPDSVDNDRLLREEARHKREEKDSRIRNARLAALIVAVIFSMVFAAGMGAALALWDTGKSVADLNKVIFDGNSVAEASDDSISMIASQNVEEVDNIADETDDTVEPINESDIERASEDSNNTVADSGGDVQDDVKDADDSRSEVDVIYSSEEISGLGNVVRAGSGDTIELKSIFKDPLENYPLEFTTVQEDYFKDALFIGDSRLHGFGLWSGIESTFYTSVGFQLYKYEKTKVVQTENGKLPILDAMPDDAFTKVYIKVGLNEMGWANEEKFEKLYAELIEKIRQKEPRAIIYIHGILPVTASKVAEGTAHNNVNIDNRNEALKKFAVEQKAYFIDVGEVYKGSDGCLPANMASDGIHLKAQYMKDWVQYLKEHAIVLK